MEEKCVLAWLFRRYTITATDRRDQVDMKGELIIRPSNGIHVRLRRRSHNLVEL